MSACRCAHVRARAQRDDYVGVCRGAFVRRYPVGSQCTVSSRTVHEFKFEIKRLCGRGRLLSRAGPGRDSVSEGAWGDRLFIKATDPSLHSVRTASQYSNTGTEVRRTSDASSERLLGRCSREGLGATVTLSRRRLKRPSLHSGD